MMQKLKLQNLSAKLIIFWVIAFSLLIGALLFTRQIVRCFTLFNLSGVPAQDCGTINQPNGPSISTPDANVTPDGTNPQPTAIVPVIPNPEANLPDAWDGASRVNILFVGLDAGETIDVTTISADRTGPSRSDTMILFSLDPVSKTAGMISIPRDLWVDIPGFGYGKINTAYYLGDANKLPGGGPALAMKTVEQVLGVSVQYYAQVDFMTFVRMVDEIGGIDINVQQKVKIDPLGPGADDRYIPRGLRHFDGMLALAYARARHTANGDVDRARRQQEVIFAIRDKVLDPLYFPTLISKAPALYNEMSAGINTNLSLDDILKLAVLGRDIPPSAIKAGIIDDKTMSIAAKSPDGLDILKPITDKIRALRDEIFNVGGTFFPMAQGDAATLMRQEAMRVSVLNGTYTQGIAATTGNYLLAQGFNVIKVDSASQLATRTILIVHNGAPYTLRYLVQIFGIDTSQRIRFDFNPAAEADIEIIIGDDWAANNPMP
jgi:LCP family protein required for cell wall assembly